MSAPWVDRAGFVWVVLVLTSAVCGRADGARLAPDVRAALEAEGRVRVCVSLEATPSGSGGPDERGRAYARARRAFLGDLPGGCTVAWRFAHSPVVMLEVTAPAALDALATRADVKHIGLDVSGGGALVESIPVLRADKVHEELGFRGEGTVVAVLDTGINATHPDLSGAVVRQRKFLDQGKIVDKTAEDEHGHGSNVASIVASRGSVAPVGVAPAAGLVAVQVLDEENRGWVSDWTRGVEYVVALHDRATGRDDGVAVGLLPPGEEGVVVDALNMSLVTDILFPDVCDDVENAVLVAFSEACRAAAERGIVVVAASGNDFSIDSIGAPACFGSVISVGSVRDTLPNTISPFTNRNEHLDLLAPGQSIEGIGLGSGLIEFRGTSQAAPHVAGSVALLREASPSLGVDAVLSLLSDNGVPVTDPESGLVFPRVDAFAAVRGIVPRFSRADCNGDGQTDVSDPVMLLLFMFSHASIRLPCESACDSNDDGVLDLTDAVVALDFMFRLGSRPPGPFPECGAETTPDGLECRTSPCL